MSELMAQYNYNVQKGPWHEDLSNLPADRPETFPVRYIAYYLPQFHAIDVNDQAWGVGFTEWTNSSKALPRYKGHYQPRMPADLGFYNLENKDVIEKQAQLAGRGGIYGFCIHYYWFSGKKVLEKPLSIILNNPQIDIKFCVNWANENWTRKWDGQRGTVLLKQEYNSEDPVRFAQDLAQIIQDKRYIRIDGRPLVMLYRSVLVPEIEKTVDIWREYLTRVGLGNPFVIMPLADEQDDPRVFGLDGAAGFPPHKFHHGLRNDRRYLHVFDSAFEGKVIEYDQIMKQALDCRPSEFQYFPGLFTSWDNEARIENGAFSFYGSTPKKYGEWLYAASQQALGASSPDARIVFINAWNEWAEGAYLEPDRHFGFAYLAETRRVFNAIAREGSKQNAPESSHASQTKVEGRFVAQPRAHRLARNAYFALRRRLQRKMEKIS